MTLPELRSQIIREIEGGILTDESRYDFLDIEAKINYGRASVIQNFFTKNKRVSGEWIQTYNAVYDKNIQISDDFVRFTVPRGIPLDILRDGYIYIGNFDGNLNYIRVNNRAELNNYNNHRNTKSTVNRPKALYAEGVIDIYGNTMIKELRIDGIFANPIEIPTYNQDIDNYPISEDLIAPLKQFLLKTVLGIEVSKPADTVSDGTETQSKRQ